MPRFAANLSMMFNEHPFLDRFAAAADCGFKAVEFLFPYTFDPDEIAKRLDDARLEQVLFNMPPGEWGAGDRGLAALPGRRDEFRRSVVTALRYARILNTPKLHVMAGIAAPDDPAAIASYRESLRFAADMAGEAGIGLLIEPLNGRDMPGYFLNHFDRAVAFIDELQQPALKLQFDIYHREILHGGVIASLEALMPLIGHIQVASVPDRHEPGSGILDDFAVFEALDRLGYTGWVGCEYRPAATTRDGLGWLERAKSL